MNTREITFTADQIRLIRQWADIAWSNADQQRMLTHPGSPQEASCLADQLDIEKIKRLLAK